MIEQQPKETAELLFNALSETIEAKNTRIKLINHTELHITRQTDIPGIYRIDVDYPTDEQAIKNHYIAQIVVHLDGSGIELAMEKQPAAARFHLADYQSVLFNVAETIINY